MITYRQTTSELFDLQKFAIKLGLENITTLTAHYRNPQQNFPSIHIAGTNGKGSTAFYIAQILQACGLQVGLFTSPHLKDFRERIRINDQLIAEDYIIDFWQGSKELIHKLKATFFDSTTLMALKYFSDKKVDIAVIETGLGGRLDSTNILQPQSVVLTPVDFDHQKQLGSDILSIAAEKAGIIKHNASVFISKQNSEVKHLFLSKADHSNTVFFLEDYFKTEIIDHKLTHINFKLTDIKTETEYVLKTPTPATYQIDNISLAFLVAKNYCESNKSDFNVNKVKSTLSKIYWPGRLQVVQKSPIIIHDVSHNFEGIVKTLDSLFKITNPANTDLLLGIVNDKDAQSICNFLAGKFRRIIVTEPNTIRKQDGKILVEFLTKKNQNTKFIKDLQTAYEISKKDLRMEDTLIALGSHYLIGSLING